MTHDVQFILDKSKKPTHAILDIDTYQDLIRQGKKDLPASPSLLSEDGLRITLPHGGPSAHIDLVRLVDYFIRRSLSSLAISARQQTLDKFQANQLRSLDPMLRICFLPKDSPYRNTMQATNEVVDALVETGLFARSKRSFSEEHSTYYRPVNALDFLAERGKTFLTGKNEPINPIPLFFWAKSDCNNLV
jgi:hypothetical protein